MNVQKKVERNKSQQQWQTLYELIVGQGVTVEFVESQPDLPDLVFTANAGFVHDKKAIVSKFKFPERQGEESYFYDWFKSNGFEPQYATDHFEGAGDALKWGKQVILGYGFRSNLSYYETTDHFRTLGFEPVTCELVDPYFYHLDTCFCPIDDENAIIYSKAFSRDAIEKLKQIGTLHEIPEADSKKFACNMVLLNKKTAIIPSGCEATKKILTDLGLEVFDCDMSEFIKSGGACKCLTLDIS